MQFCVGLITWDGEYEAFGASSKQTNSRLIIYLPVASFKKHTVNLYGYLQAVLTTMR